MIVMKTLLLVGIDDCKLFFFFWETDDCISLKTNNGKLCGSSLVHQSSNNCNIKVTCTKTIKCLFQFIRLCHNYFLCYGGRCMWINYGPTQWDYLFINYYLWIGTMGLCFFFFFLIFTMILCWSSLVHQISAVIWFFIFYF